MTTPRPVHSREPSWSYEDDRSTSSTRDFGRNVFSDDYALDSASSEGDASPVDSLPTHDQSPQDEDIPQPSINIIPYPAIPSRLSQMERTPSMSSRTTNIDDGYNLGEGGLDRSLSNSSRFSFPRSQSPYLGPTAPSHPYAMYPQVTRASSIASEATLRPHPETPFVPRGGPEHPYAMYMQNTVPEEDEDITVGGIPLPFHGPTTYQTSSGASNSDVGDIVGSDGHIEQLPPYTRYADNVVAKGDMAAINVPPESQGSSTQSTTLAASTSTSREQLQIQQPEEFERLEEEANAREGEKKGIRGKLQGKVCGVMPLWCMIAIILAVVFAGVIGGVIGGVVGNRRGTDAVLDAASAATTTVWLDADPASTGPSTPSLPTGRYTIPLNQSKEIKTCVNQTAYDAAWGCMDYAYIGVNIAQSDPNAPMQVVFDDYSVNTANFRYGPQPPDFNGSAFDLKPFSDRDNTGLGVAMFFSVLFDKLSIIPGPALTPVSGKRSVSEREVLERTAAYDGTPLQIGDQPWFCFWNSTINEFWIFLDDPNPDANSTSTITSAASVPTSSTNTSMVVAQAVSATSTSYGSTFAAYQPSYTGTYNLGMTYPTPTAVKRDQSYTTGTPYTPEYPRLIKMIEKRKPSGNISPYCQKMQVLNNWQIVPREDQENLCIEEIDYGSPGGGNRRRGVESLLESNCICEWMSI